MDGLSIKTNYKHKFIFRYTDKHLTMQIVHLDCWSICLHVYNTDKLSDKLSCLSLNLIACFKTCQLFSLFLIIHISHSSAAQISTSFRRLVVFSICAPITRSIEPKPPLPPGSRRWHWTRMSFWSKLTFDWFSNREPLYVRNMSSSEIPYRKGN
jgi:hypothetical protein